MPISVSALTTTMATTNGDITKHDKFQIQYLLFILKDICFLITITQSIDNSRALCLRRTTVLITERHSIAIAGPRSAVGRAPDS